jgi:glycosyltransferase involved in cell wall biosynthesis
VSRLLALNSLDARHGSTYRLRPLITLLAEAGHAVRYVEGAGSALRRLLVAVHAAAGDYELLVTQKFNPVTLAAMALARLRGRPVLADWDDLDPGLQGTAPRRLLATVCEALGPHLATVITTHSEPIRARARRRRPTFLVPQGCDPRRFRPGAVDRAAARARFGLAGAAPVAGHLCTFTHGGTLDLGVILDAFAAPALRDARFLLVGGGPLEGAIRRGLARRGLTDRVRLTGLLPHEEVPAALACLDVGVVYMSDRPANRARVSFKVLEYLAMGLPVVGRLVGESARRFGHLVVPADAADLAPAIARTLAAPVAPPPDAVAGYAWAASAAPLVAAVATALAEAPCR